MIIILNSKINNIKNKKFNKKYEKIKIENHAHEQTNKENYLFINNENLSL